MKNPPNSLALDLKKHKNTWLNNMKNPQTIK